MNKKLFITFITICCTVCVQAQTVFSTMESWKTGNVGFPAVQLDFVDGWRCPDSLAHAYGFALGGTPERQLFKSTDSHGGTYAAIVVTKEQGMLGNVAGILTNAVINLDIVNQDFTLTGGTPIYGRVYYVNAWVKYLPKGGDSAFVAVSALKVGAGAGGADSILGEGVHTITASQPYTLINVPITYENTSLNPDALQIIFGSSSEQATIGSELFVDDVSYSIFPASTNNIAENRKITVYPNPASDKLYINSNRDEKTITLYSMDGRQVMSKSFAGNMSLNVASLPQGNYCYTLADDNGTIIQRQTITIVR